MDEIHTPDSSRYFYAEGYEERFQNNEAQKQLSKEFVREWLMDNGFQGKEGQQVPEMTDEIVMVSANATKNCMKRLRVRPSKWVARIISWNALIKTSLLTWKISKLYGIHELAASSLSFYIGAFDSTALSFRHFPRKCLDVGVRGLECINRRCNPTGTS